MVILGWLTFRDISKFRLIFITHKAIYIYIYIYIYMGFPEYLRKRVRIRAATRPSRTFELIKLYVPFFAYMYADAALTVATQKYWY